MEKLAQLLHRQDFDANLYCQLWTTLEFSKEVGLLRIEKRSERNPNVGTLVARCTTPESPDIDFLIGGGIIQTQDRYQEILKLYDKRGEVGGLQSKMISNKEVLPFGRT